MQNQAPTTGRTEQAQKKLTQRIAERFGVDADKILDTLKVTAFRQKDGSAAVTNEQMMVLLIIAEQYNLNPFTRELYAYPDKGGIVPVVGVDGWARIINEHEKFEGMEFVESTNWVNADGAKVSCPEWIECVIHRSDRKMPTKIREYLDETYRPPFKGKNNYTVEGPWQSHTKRMLRHKAMIQCARIAFGFGGFVDADEAERIFENQNSMSKMKDVRGEVVGDSQPQIQYHHAQQNNLSLTTEKKEQINSFVDKVVGRSISYNAWEAGVDLIEQRLKSDVSELDYAIEQYRMKQENYLISLPEEAHGEIEQVETKPSSQKSEKTEDMVEVQVELSEQNKVQPDSEELVIPAQQGQDNFF